MGRHHEEDTVRLQPPVDPWPDAHDGSTQPIPVSGVRPRRAYGYVYELVTGDPQDGPHPYAGQTTTTIHQRVHGPNGHTSAGSIAKDPWKARIRPGRAGYRCLRTVYATSDETADQMRLDLAEAVAIDELKTTYNIQRPIRTAGPAPVRAPRQSAPSRRPRPRRRVPWRAVGFLLLASALTYLAARLVVAMELPWPAVSWIAPPVIGIALGWRIFWAAHRRVRRLTAPARRR